MLEDPVVGANSWRLTRLLSTTFCTDHSSLVVDLWSQVYNHHSGVQCQHDWWTNITVGKCGRGNSRTFLSPLGMNHETLYEEIRLVQWEFHGHRYLD